MCGAEQTRETVSDNRISPGVSEDAGDGCPGGGWSDIMGPRRE